ncbi:MAG TPA: LLM class flavin-dependent oxidoreductase [Thermoleophilaceae bacterium]|nr:LLM class flavin-dependent oxidoreductase [Thermoleophilaceae bacterium]
MRLDVSVGVSPRERLADWADFGAALEDHGVDRIWLIDSQLAMKDVYAGLVAAALKTRRVELGTGVTNLVTRHPTVTAGAIAALAELSDGRALLGLGAGDSAVRGIGARPSRVAEVEAALRFFRAVLAGEPAEWGERSFQLPHATADVRLHLAVSRPRMCRLAGMVADGAIVMGPAQPDLVAEQVGWVRDGALEAGRDPAEVEISLVATMSVSDDVESALADVRSWASAQARLLADVKELPDSLERHRGELERAKRAYDFGEHLSTRAGHQQAIGDELVSALAIAGTPEECAARLAALLGVGVDRLIFPLMGAGRLQRLETIREQVMTRIRTRAF